MAIVVTVVTASMVDFGRGSGVSIVASRVSGSTGIALEALVTSVLEL
jgi:hypothetical protein